MSKKGLKKEAVIGSVQDREPIAVTDEELALINKYTRRQLSKDEVYVFSVVLCDNDIDRDGERFTVESLFALEKLFVGKTGIFDHNPTAKNQTARIFACAVEAVDGRKTATGDDYFRLKARAYLPVSEKNSDIILALDSGIIKEVSVGCAVEEVLCSICGEKSDTCPHRKGETYGSKICCGELINPYDAYEWSFVAVPAQPAAGVTKSRSVRRALCLTPERALAEMEKGELHLDAVSAAGLRRHIALLERQSEEAGRYRRSLCEEIRRSALLAQPELEPALLEKGMTALSVGELETLGQLMRRQAERRFAPTVQTAPPPQDPGNDNSPFCI